MLWPRLAGQPERGVREAGGGGLLLFRVQRLSELPFAVRASLTRKQGKSDPDLAACLSGLW